MSKEHEYVYCCLTQSVKTIRKRNRMQSREDQQRAATCMLIALVLGWHYPKLSEKHIRMKITRDYFHMLWLYCLKYRKPSGKL